MTSLLGLLVDLFYRAISGHNVEKGIHYTAIGIEQHSIDLVNSRLGDAQSAPEVVGHRFPPAKTTEPYPTLEF
jgi:hypothetical protein